MKPTTSLVIAGFCALSALPQSACAQAQAVLPANAIATPAATADLRHFLRQSTGDPAVAAAPETPGMKLIPGGDVVIGTAADQVEKLGQKDPVHMIPILAEVPRHKAKVGDFLIDTTEVTNLQWQIYLEATGRKPTKTLIDINWPDGKIPAGFEQHPITNVNIAEIRDFLEWCGKRLPTEVEWERAARGDDDRDFPWGAKWNGKLCRSGMDSTGHAEAVGTFPGGASPFGVLDMTGNVLEWVDAKFTPYEGFAPMTVTAQKKERQLVPDFASNVAVVKGGSFQTTSTGSRIDARYGVPPGDSGEALGFRSARSIHPGVDSIRHGLRRLQPAQLVGPGVDEEDCFAREDMTYDDALNVIKGYRVLTFAHRGPERGPSLTKLRSTSVDEPAALGVLFTTEGLKMPDMVKPGAKSAAMLPSGAYLLSFKAKGESKSHKEKRREHKKDGDKAESDGGDKSSEKPASVEPPKPAEKDSKAKSKDAKDGKDAKEPKKVAAGAAGKVEPVAKGDDAKGDDSEAPGAAVPWPGVSSVHSATEDIEYPQDEDLILFINDNNAVVGWARSGSIEEVDLAPHKAAGSDENHKWAVDFSLDQMAGKRGPRFHIELEVAGNGI